MTLFQMLSVISQLPTAFNLGYDTLSDNTGCDESGDITAAYKGIFYMRGASEILWLA